MKKLFDKENFVSRGLERGKRGQSIFITVLLVLIFILGAFVFMNGLYAFADIIGSIVSGSIDVALKDLMRSWPLILAVFMVVWLILLLHAVYRNVDEERRMKSIFKDGICLIVFGGISILYIVIMRIAGVYKSLVEGSPTSIYPLDSFIFGIAIVALGVLAVLYAKKFKEQVPYEVPSRGPIVTKARGLYCTFMSFWLLIALFGLSGGIFSLFIYDFIHGYAFFGIAVVIAYLMNPIFLCVWEFYYNDLKEEKKKELLLPLSFFALGASVISVALYMISLGTSLDAPSNAGFGMFPVAFAASVNIATLLVVFAPLIVSIVALIKGILARKAK